MRSVIALALAGASFSVLAPPSSPALRADLAASVRITATPDPATTIPPYLDLLSEPPPVMSRGGAFPWKCIQSGTSPSMPPHPQTACAFGDVASRRVVLLAGDSQAEMWLGAMNVAGQRDHFKIVFLDMLACAPWGDPNPPGFVIYADTTVAGCDRWRHLVEREAKVLKVHDVVLDGLAYPTGSDVDVHANQADFDARLLASVDAFRAPGRRVILLSPLPSWNHFRAGQLGGVNYCFEYETPITRCDFPPSQLGDPVAAAGEAMLVRRHLATQVDVESLLCTKRRCAVFVKGSDGDHLVYVDGHHINFWYSAWVGRAMARLFAHAL